MADQHMTFRQKCHHVPVPSWFIYVRVAQLIIASMCAGLAAYITKNLPWLEVSDLMVFVGFSTLIYVAYVLLATTIVPIIYNFWLILVLEILCPFFWVSSILALGIEIAIVTAGTHLISDAENDLTGKYLGHEFSSDMFHHTKIAGTAACVFGVINFATFCVTSVTFVNRLRRFRKSGGKALPSFKGSKPSFASRGAMQMQMQVESSYNPVSIANEGQKDYMSYGEITHTQIDA